ncbi:MAG: hypothetical protein HYY93_13515 [Planctomycetes bacterium]|nr:hypothetical protein [Planctomycetota bacterium]
MFTRFFGKPGERPLREYFGFPKRLDSPAVVLPRLSGILVEAARGIEGREPDPELVFARLCDAFRSMPAEPVDDAVWKQAAAGRAAGPPPSEEVAEALKIAITKAGWRRLHLLVESLQDPAIHELVRLRTAERDPDRTAVLLFLAFANGTELLTIDLLLKSPFRVEEFARKWVAAIGGTVAEEPEKRSAQRLRNLDYGEVLGNLQKAQKQREEHHKRLAEIERQRKQEEYERSTRE